MKKPNPFAKGDKGKMAPPFLKGGKAAMEKPNPFAKKGAKKVK